MIRHRRDKPLLRRFYGSPLCATALVMLALLPAGGLSSSVRADELRFLGGDFFYSNPANWLNLSGGPNRVPNVTDTVVFDQTGLGGFTFFLDVNAINETLRFEVGSTTFFGLGGPKSYNLLDDLIVTGTALEFRDVDLDVFDSMFVSGGSQFISDSDVAVTNLFVGTDLEGAAGGDGTMALVGGKLLVTDDTAIGGDGHAGSLTLRATSNQLFRNTFEGTVRVGSTSGGGSGLLKIEERASVTAAALEIHSGGALEVHNSFLRIGPLGPFAPDDDVQVTRDLVIRNGTMKVFDDDGDDWPQLGLRGAAMHVTGPNALLEFGPHPLPGIGLGRVLMSNASLSVDDGATFIGMLFLQDGSTAVFDGPQIRVITETDDDVVLSASNGSTLTFQNGAAVDAPRAQLGAGGNSTVHITGRANVSVGRVSVGGDNARLLVDGPLTRLEALGDPATFTTFRVGVFGNQVEARIADGASVLATRAYVRNGALLEILNAGMGVGSDASPLGDVDVDVAGELLIENGTFRVTDNRVGDDFGTPLVRLREGGSLHVTGPDALFELGPDVVPEFGLGRVVALDGGTLRVDGGATFIGGVDAFGGTAVFDGPDTRLTAAGGVFGAILSARIAGELTFQNQVVAFSDRGVLNAFGGTINVTSGAQVTVARATAAANNARLLVEGAGTMLDVLGIPTNPDATAFRVAGIDGAALAEIVDGARVNAREAIVEAGGTLNIDNAQFHAENSLEVVGGTLQVRGPQAQVTYGVGGLSLTDAGNLSLENGAAFPLLGAPAGPTSYLSDGTIRLGSSSTPNAAGGLRRRSHAGRGRHDRV